MKITFLINTDQDNVKIEIPELKLKIMNDPPFDKVSDLNQGKYLVILNKQVSK